MSEIANYGILKLRPDESTKCIYVDKRGVTHDFPEYIKTVDDICESYLELSKKCQDYEEAMESLAKELRSAIIRSREEGVSSPALEFVCSKLELDAREVLSKYSKGEK